VPNFLNILGSLRHLFSNDKKYYRAVRTLLGFRPGNLALYKTAFRHKSVVASQDTAPSSNERMEYLGDAVFGAVIAHYLFKKFPYKDEGFLTKMRSKMVSREFLNKLALKLGIDQLILFQGDSHSRFKSINGDAFEALIGAIYLDQGYHFTRNFIIQKIIHLHIDIDDLEHTDTDFKSQLIHHAQKVKKTIEFILEEEIGKGQHKQYKVALHLDGICLSHGIHFSKKKAEQEASRIALESLLKE
jgi:ribonuclease III